MFARQIHIALPRRVTAYFLLFGLAAVVWLAAGLYFVSTAISQSRSTSGLLSTVGKASNRLVLKYLNAGATELQAEVEQLHRQNALAYCAVVAPTGEYLAHSAPEEVGNTADEPTGSVESWGDVDRVRFVNEQGVLVVEFRTPLRAADRLIGTLRVGVVEPSALATLLVAARYGPLAIVGPLLFMGLGAVILRRLVRPVAGVDLQLRRVAAAPSIIDCALEQVEVCGAASLGWNRLVEHATAGRKNTDLHERLSESLEGVRQKKLACILNCLTDGVLTTDRDGRITYHNSSALGLLERRQRPRTSGDGRADREGDGDADHEGGASTEEARTATIRAGESETPSHAKPAAPPTARQAVSLEGESLLVWLGRNWELPPASPLLQEAFKQRTVVVELERAGEGPRRVLRVTRSPLFAGPSSEQDCHVWTLRDVTQQKLADEMRTQFVDTATHELRTPLANIKAYAETLALQEMVDLEEQKDFLNTINAEATRLARFVDDLLSVSSMEIGSLSLNRTATDLERLFKGVIGKVKPQMTEKDITFETQFPEKWPEPELDKDKFAATLVNLLGNAVKYTPAGGRVALGVKATGGQLQISVEDTGIGISKEDIPKLFDKFFRSSDPRVLEVTGTGLGLSLANEIVRLHGGRISVESELNKGSTFLVTVPLN
jgi:signal transduction histidine kinase